jgi:selenide, water dikinase
VAKLAPGDLAQVLGKLPKQDSRNVIVGFDTADDAGVFRLDDQTALVQTLDFFTPISDDPRTFGRVAAINALNDVYAMGGKPLTALSIVCYPQKGDWDVLGEILAGGQEALNSEGVVVLGGHSVDDQEIKFGYAVTGIVNPNDVKKNSDAKPGDVLILTKPIGTGVISTGIKFQKASQSAIDAQVEAMTSSARIASEVMVKYRANACTDITGFGLLGHAFEMAKGSKKTLRIESGSVPLLPDVIELISQKMLTRGDRNNRAYVGDTLNFHPSVTSEMQSALFDPQTAGGLLISSPKESVDAMLEKLPFAKVIGTVEEYTGHLLEVS